MAENDQMKKCPYCAEMVKAEAIVCRYCGKTIEEPEKTTEDKIVNVGKQMRNIGLILTLLAVGVIAVICLVIALSGML